jgi:polyhydroxybutyrate depolymerase
MRTTSVDRLWRAARRRRPATAAVRAAAVAVVLLLVAGACSGDDEADQGAEEGSDATVEAAGTTATTDTAGATAAPVEVATGEHEPVGTVSHGTLSFDGVERTYRLYVPRELPDEPVPLFIGLHGGLGWGDQFATTDHIEGLAESNGFIVVHPDGVQVAEGVGIERSGVWNGGVCCGIAARSDADDVGFIAALIDEVEADHEIDPDRVFAYGHSNGGIMSYRLACELADRIVGIGVVAGTLGVDDCEPAEPVSVLHIHGTADENLPLAGGVGAESVGGVAFPPPREGFATLADADGCGDPTETTDGDVTTALSEPCDAGTAAAFVTIEGGPHAWPGGTPAVRPRSGPGYPDYDATFEIVRFLLAHPRR